MTEKKVTDKKKPGRSAYFVGVDTEQFTCRIPTATVESLRQIAAEREQALPIVLNKLIQAAIKANAAKA